MVERVEVRAHMETEAKHMHVSVCAAHFQRFDLVTDPELLRRFSHNSRLRLKKTVTQSISSYIQGKRPAPKRSAVEKRRVYEVGESASVSVTVRPPCPGH